MGANQKDSSFSFNSYCTSVQIKWSQCVQQNPTGCLHFFFFSNNPCISLQFFYCWLLFQPWPIMVYGSTKVQGDLEQLLAKWNKKHLQSEKERGQITQTWAYPFQTGTRAHCKNVCQYWVGRENLTELYTDIRVLHSRYLSISQLCPDLGIPKLLEL